MIFALSTGHEIGLASVGAAFILFALLSSFVFPRKWPDFPGRKGMRWYIPLAVCFFIAMISAVLVFGVAKKSAAAPPATSTPASSRAGAELTSEPYAGGNAAAGKAVFTSAGCSACHTLKAAASTGTIGPNLDQITVYAKKANAGARSVHLRGDHPSARGLRAAGLPDQRHAGNIRAVAHRQRPREPRRVRRELRQRLSEPIPGGAPLRCPGSGRSGRVAEGGALLRRYGGLILHRGFESLLLRSRRGFERRGTRHLARGAGQRRGPEQLLVAGLLASAR